ncbi:STAS domain-containing protein [Heyndrickxia acidicola]|uniref:STAS domain-containing protein n=1 Tax=Heyndrickxia acidicola TaxID=209389 RepID=A0ABU6MM23_9BACI|nr:STAS domain-containing protein [Heyndrickxia acidicola]MED1205733.1 STAS domain-containing protein [Heyndrickxia acidicola]
MRNQEFEYIGRKIVENRYTLARMISKYIYQYTTNNFEQSRMPETDYTEIRAEIMGYFGEALYNEEIMVNRKVEDWARRAGDLTIKYNISLTESLRMVSVFRIIVWEIFTEELQQNHISCTSLVDISEKFHNLLDSVFRIFGEVHEKYNRSLLNTAYKELEELSVPVVPLARRLAVIPLIGAVDTYRAELIMKSALSESNRLGLEKIIFDLSGVPIIDSLVSNLLFQVIKSLKLMGVESIITGIRPSIAQTITRLGIDFHFIQTFSSMQQALNELGFKQVETK